MGSSDEAISSAILHAYEALDFAPGSAPDWARFDAVFDPSAVLALRVFPQDSEISVLSLREYAVAQMQHGLGAEGYSETPGNRRIEIVGDTAVVRQDFTMNFSGRKPVPAVDMFSLVRREQRWLIVCVVSDVVESR